ncbi:MAG: CPC_1213 family protein [Sedimentibacter sp.]|uniref:CPC_1213 family protein n=1 Tax=Sedimentibacter sp. TaxID=1960295 RepID=UPI0029811A70|nr:CPC_1213 family protein [Sedimentibacter sp.]MDW5298588.1 CPC_1213 family protein [Sedimentibacter sp.]
MSDNKMKSTKNNKKEDGKFHSKNIKHNPQAESARAVFGLKDDNFQNLFDSSEKKDR